jgi:hypothetical protein
MPNFPSSVASNKSYLKSKRFCPVRKVYLSVTLFCFVCMCLFCVWKKAQATPTALSKRHFDQSLCIKELGSSFVLHRKLDNEMRALAHNAITLRKAEWRAGQHSNIPLVIHQIWPRDEQIPDQYSRTARTVQIYNSDATYILWNHKDVEKLLTQLFGNDWKDLPLDVVRDLAAAAVLWQHGGIVVDLESECVHSIRSLLSLGDCIIGFEPPRETTKFQRRLFLSSSVIAAAPAHPIIKTWLAEMWRRALLMKDDPHISSLWVSQESLTRVAAALHDRGRPLFVGPAYFCPVRPSQIQKLKRSLDGQARTRFFKRLAQTLHIISVPLYSRVARETLFVHMSGGRLSKKSIFEE